MEENKLAQLRITPARRLLLLLEQQRVQYEP
jgi:hypothetical protein